MRWFSIISSVTLLAAAACAAPDESMFSCDRPELPAVQELEGLDLITPRWSMVHALQFGPASNEVLYLVLDTTDELRASNRLHIYSPALRDYRKPQLEKGTRTRRELSSSRKQYYYRFSPIRFEASFGRTDVAYVLVVRSLPDELELLVNCQVEKRGRRSRFLLSRSFKPAAVESGVVPFDRILCEPELIIDMDNRAKQSRIVTRLRMGGYAMLPVSGMKDRIELKVTDHTTARLRFRDRVELDEETFEKGVKLVPSKRLMPGRTYLVTAFADLGDVFGEQELTAEVIPAK